MTDLHELRDVWEAAARQDPLFAVLSDPSKRGGGWDLDAFFASGSREIQTVLEHVRSCGIDVPPRGPALDFGCGVGRLTRPLAAEFGHCTGVDIASGMLDTAATINAEVSGCEFRLNDRPDLSAFESGTFGFVYSNIVLQHMEPRLAQGYIAEFVRLLRDDGVAVFQVPTGERLSAVDRVRRTLRIRTRLRQLRGDASLTDDRVEWEMHGLPEESVRTTVANAGGRVVEAAWTNATDPDFNGRLRYLEQPRDHGWVSRSYVVVPTGRVDPTS